MITITGATGNLGSAVISNLLQKGVEPSNITALIRTMDKAQDLSDKGVVLKLGNYNKYESLVKAFKGTDKLLFVSSSEMENRDKQQVSVVKAAKEAGVKHILYTSVQRQSDDQNSPISFVTKDHIATENAIKESGMKYTILRNNLYMDILPWILGEKVFETGVFYPAQQGKVAFALRSDMAEAIVNILVSDHHENKEYNISNPNDFTFDDIASHLSSVSGKSVNYNSPSVEKYIATLTDAGAPEMVAGFLAGFAQGAAQGEFVAADTDLAKLLGREAVTYKEFLTSIYGQN